MLEENFGESLLGQNNFNPTKVRFYCNGGIFKINIGDLNKQTNILNNEFTKMEMILNQFTPFLGVWRVFFISLLIGICGFLLQFAFSLGQIETEIIIAFVMFFSIDILLTYLILQKWQKQIDKIFQQVSRKQIFKDWSYQKESSCFWCWIGETDMPQSIFYTMEKNKFNFSDIKREAEISNNPNQMTISDNTNELRKKEFFVMPNET